MRTESQVDRILGAIARSQSSQTPTGTLGRGRLGISASSKAGLLIGALARKQLSRTRDVESTATIEVSAATDDRSTTLAKSPDPQRRHTPPSSAPMASAGFLTVAEAASRLRVSKMTVYRLVNARDLEAVRVGRSFRIPLRAVEERIRSANADKS